MNENVKNIIKHPATIPVAVGIASLAAGAVGGYLIGFRKGRTKGWTECAVHYESDILNSDDGRDTQAPPKVVIDSEDMETLRERWAEQGDVPAAETVMSERLLTEKEVDTLVSNVSESDNTPEDQKLYLIEDDAPDSNSDVIETNIFANSGEDWDYEAEIAKRADKDFYIIHADEFHGQEADYDQRMLTYYAGDDLLCDEDEVLIPNYIRTVGYLEFGHGSNDPNVVYVRNDVRETDYEILLHSGSYSREVMGLDIESERVPQRLGRMRNSDDEET